MEQLIPTALVLGCNTPVGINPLSDWIEEQTGHPPDFQQPGWADADNSTSSVYIDINYLLCGNGSGDGRNEGFNTSYGDGTGCGHNYGLEDGDGFGDGCQHGNGLGSGNGYGYGGIMGDGYTPWFS